MEAEYLCDIAKKAGGVLLNFFRGTLWHTSKTGRANVVTEADIFVEELIRAELGRLFSGIPVIGEEMSNSEEKMENTYFLVDPLDGTLNFLHGIPFFAVSIALVEESVPKIGVVYAPALGETFCAVANHGAFFNNKPIKIKKSLSIQQALVATGWPYDRKLLSWAERALLFVQKRVREVRILGAASLGMSYIATGFLDIYWEIGLYPWDLAAGWLIVKEAGGCVLDVTGECFNLSSGRVLAGVSDALCLEVVSLFKNIECDAKFDKWK